MENINLIRKIAWSFHHTTGLDWDDLFQEAALAYLEGFKSYNPNKGALSTHMWIIMSSHLKNYLKKETEWHSMLCDLEEAFEQQSYSDHFWNTIPEEIQEQTKIILQYAPDLDVFLLEGYNPLEREYKTARGQKHARILIRQILRRAGYEKDEIHGTVSQLQFIFQ
jgi:hypothetical protein